MLVFARGESSAKGGHFDQYSLDERAFRIGLLWRRRRKDRLTSQGLDMGIQRFVAVAFVGCFAVPASAQLPTEHWFSRCDAPIATCLVPQVSHRLDLALINGGIDVQDRNRAGSVCDEPIAALFEETMIAGRPSPFFAMESFAYASFELAPIPDDSSEILSRWEITAQSHLPVITAERLRMQHAAPERSGQEVALACELQGPIDAADLLKRYDWTVTDDLDAVELTAVPKDPLERLFYSRFTVTLDSATWRPISIRFPARDGRIGETVALRPWVDEAMPDVQLVAFESNERQGFVRTADLSEDSPRLLRTEAVLELPPAPIPCEPKVVREPVEAVKP